MPTISGDNFRRGFFHIFKRDILGINYYLNTEDRRILEKIIFPYFLGADEYRNILFVGCRWYTRGYNKLFEQRRNYWTIEPAQSERRYGAKQHITDTLQNLAHHFSPGTFDLIFCNGLIGFGLDTMSDAELAFQACYDGLRPGGVLVLGWNDIEKRRPFYPDQCRSLSNFKPFFFPPLAATKVLTDTPNRHTYSFYIK